MSMGWTRRLAKLGREDERIRVYVQPPQLEGDAWVAVIYTGEPIFGRGLMRNMRFTNELGVGRGPTPNMALHEAVTEAEMAKLTRRDDARA